jgi:hypothetical protein
MESQLCLSGPLATCVGAVTQEICQNLCSQKLGIYALWQCPRVWNVFLAARAWQVFLTAHVGYVLLTARVRRPARVWQRAHSTQI